MANKTIRQLGAFAGNLDGSEAWELETSANASAFGTTNQIKNYVAGLIKGVMADGNPYANIAARDLAAATMQDLEIVEVTDASDDPTVVSGRAWYRKDIGGVTFVKIMSEESLRENISGLNLFALWDFDTATADADPGSGNVRLDNTDLSLATNMYISNFVKGGTDVSSLLQGFAIGTKIAHQQTDDPTKQSLFETSGAVVDATTYQKIPLTFLAKGSGIGGGATFDNASELVIRFFEELSGVSGQDEVEVIPFDADFDTVHEQSYVTPLQIADIPSPGITSLAFAYSVKTDDEVTEYGDLGQEENVSLATLNLNLAGRGGGTFVYIKTAPVVNRLSAIRRTKNMS